jgi:hypothetical protein
MEVYKCCCFLFAQVYDPYDLVVVKSKEEVDPQFFYVLTQTGKPGTFEASCWDSLSSNISLTDVLPWLPRRVGLNLPMHGNALQVSPTCGVALHMT